MPSTINPYTVGTNRVGAGTGYDGVVRVSAGGYYGTGTLLFDGRAILTAAHLFDTLATISATAITVYAEDANGIHTLHASDVQIIESYDPININNDIAIVWLSDDAPRTMERYGLYRSDSEIGQTMTFVGYGNPATGSLGLDSSYTGAPIKQFGTNTFDASMDTLYSDLYNELGWHPKIHTQMIADFDNGIFIHDALGVLLGINNLGTGDYEAIISPGDSGGPAFIDRKIAGIASYVTSLSKGTVHPDINATLDNSYGEIASWDRVSYYQEWIDTQMRAHYGNAPKTALDVVKSVSEGNYGTTTLYFMVQFSGMRGNVQQIVSVDYATRDGSAIAGSDYIAANGTLNIYPTENYALIPVEIIADMLYEGDETLYLDITNPVGGTFAGNVVQLTAMRTIVNDDLI